MSTTSPDVTGADFATDYVTVPFEADETALADGAIDNLQARWDGWEPSDGDMEVVLIETLSPLASVAIANASQIPPAALIAIGTKLYGIPFQEGAPAQTTVTLTFLDAAGGYFVAAGSEFDLGAFAFTTVVDVTSVQGETQVTGVQAVAGDVGAAFNGLTGADWASVTLPVWVTDLTVEAPTSDGVDPQDATAYLNMVSRELQLRGRMVVTLPDYELVAVDTVGIGRAYAETTPAGDVTVYLTDNDGQPVPADIKSALAAVYAAARLVNTTVALADFNYTPINVDYAVVAHAGFDLAQLVVSINSALEGALSPNGYNSVTFGQPGTGSVSLQADNTIRITKLIALIGTVPGVAYVVNDSIKINGVNADFAMPGPVALPTPGVFNGTASLP